MKKMITGLDIGTTKICAVMLGVEPSGDVRLCGVGTSPARGITKGFVSNLDKLIDSIAKAVSEAEGKAGVKAHHVVTNISAASLTGKINEGLIPLSRRGREITKRDIRKAIDTTKNISLSMEKDFLYCSPHEFVIDDDHEVEDPLGLFGTKLKIKLYVVTALATHMQNISKAVSYAGYEVVDILPTTVAYRSNMLADEKMGGYSVIIDIGGGVTEIAVFLNDTLKFLNSVNVGGMDLTSRLSAHFKIPFASAEEIKKKHGSILAEDLNNDEKNIFDIENRHVVIESREMNNLLKERFDEIFHILKERLNVSGCLQGAAPNILVTGGSALMHGALESFDDLLNFHVKMGRVSGIKGEPSILNNPAYAAALSLAKHGIENKKSPHASRRRSSSLLIDSFQKFREMLEEYF